MSERLSSKENSSNFKGFLKRSLMIIGGAVVGATIGHSLVRGGPVWNKLNPVATIGGGILGGKVASEQSKRK